MRQAVLASCTPHSGVPSSHTPTHTLVITTGHGLKERSWSPWKQPLATRREAPPQPPPVVLPSSLSIIWSDLWVLCPDWLLFGDCEIVEDTGGWWCNFGRSQRPGAGLGPCSEDSA